MRNINRHKSSDKQSIMTESSFALTILLIVGITVTVGTMVLTVFFNLSLPIKIAVSAILIPDSIISMIFTISTAVKERKSMGDFYFGSIDKKFFCKKRKNVKIALVFIGYLC